ncbi:MAG: DUF4065 domain-containing protein [Bacteroidetes bacterium]|nr:DUF4065 domain-containing protein [Bacteroidota bacterium]MBU1678787.1 DUF4065 domain-containing protein [Bacteroidota bacterium]
MKALPLSEYIILHFNEVSSEGISPLKLQKILYYVYVWGIVSKKKVLSDTFLKWKYGPVNQDVYNAYKSFGNSKIANVSSIASYSLSNDDEKFVNFVVSNYVKFSALSLSAMTHQDKPWQDTELNEPISESAIKSFYSKLKFAKNFPIDEDKPFFPVETDLHYSFILDFVSSSSFPIVYKSYKEYLSLQDDSKASFNMVYQNWLGT